MNNRATDQNELYSSGMNYIVHFAHLVLSSSSNSFGLC